MQRLAVLLLALGLVSRAPASVASEPQGLIDAERAQHLLGPGIWSKIVRIENAPSRGPVRRSVYPSRVYALVFELSGILWFYTDTDGTQSLSLQRGHLKADKADPGPLFSTIDPGFGAWSWCDSSRPRSGIPSNGCFVESVSLLRDRLQSGDSVSSPRLLSFYIATLSGFRGHTVLLYSEGGHTEVVDPGNPSATVDIPGSLAGDPKRISNFIAGRRVASARVLPLDGLAYSPAGA